MLDMLRCCDQRPMVARAWRQIVSARHESLASNPSLTAAHRHCGIGLVRFFEILRGRPENRGISARLGSTFVSLHRDSH